MATTKHMTSGDVLRIRKMLARGITDIAVIQSEVKVHASRIQQVIDAEPQRPAFLKQKSVEAAAEAAEAKAKKTGIPAPAPVADEAPPVKKAAPKKAASKKKTAVDKAKAAAAAVDPIS